MMKWIPIVLAVLCALVIWVMGALALGVHKAHTFSTYSQWKRFGLVEIDEAAVEEFNANLPEGLRLDILGQLRQAGNVRANLRLLANLAAVFLLVNALCFYLVLRQYESKKSPQKGSVAGGGQRDLIWALQS